MRILTFVWVGMLASSCSFMFVSGPPPMHEQLPYFDCSSRYVAPVLDTLWGAWEALSVLGAASMTNAEWDDAFDGDPPFGRGTGVAIYGAMMLVGIASASHGYSTVSDCADAKTLLMIRMQTRPVQQGPWPPARREPPPTPVEPAPSPPPAVVPSPDPPDNGEPARTPVAPLL